MAFNTREVVTKITYGVIHNIYIYIYNTIYIYIFRPAPRRDIFGVVLFYSEKMAFLEIVDMHLSVFFICSQYLVIFPLLSGDLGFITLVKDPPPNPLRTGPFRFNKESPTRDLRPSPRGTMG